MLKLLTGLPDQVLGIEAVGEVTGEDYQSVLVPAIESKVSSHRRMRLLYVLGSDFTGFTGAAAWEDAKVGMRHFTAFERIAIVTDVDWIERMVKALGFILPGEVSVFSNKDLADARSWICEPSSSGQLKFSFLREAGVLILEPQGELEAGDFKRVAREIDPYIEEMGGLTGIVIIAPDFPGWDDFAAFTSHFQFVREHISKISRAGLVTNSRFLSAVPRIAGLFVDAEVRKFEPADRDAAIAWVTSNPKN